MTIGILTYHRASNNGAFLQAYALCSRLREEGFDCEIIDFNMVKEEKKYNSRRWDFFKKLMSTRRKKRHYKIRFEAFQLALKDNKDLRSREYLQSDDIGEFQKFVYCKYDLIIAGSDEIWRLDGMRGFPSPYWLPGDLGCRKMSYAASSRTSTEILSEEQLNTLKVLLNDFEFISVRDQMTYDEFKPLLKDGTKISINCDPSFLYDFKINKQQAREFLYQRCQLAKEKKTILVMTFDEHMKKMVSKQCQEKYNVICVFEDCKYCKTVYDTTPFEWMKMIAGADFVISSLFHGICYSILNNVPFLAGDIAKENSKILPLIQAGGFENRYLSFSDTIPENLCEYIENLMIPMDNSEFIRKQQEGFGDFVKRLRRIEEEIGRSK